MFAVERRTLLDGFSDSEGTVLDLHTSKTGIQASSALGQSPFYNEVTKLTCMAHRACPGKLVAVLAEPSFYSCVGLMMTFLSSFLSLPPVLPWICFDCDSHKLVRLPIIASQRCPLLESSFASSSCPFLPSYIATSSRASMPSVSNPNKRWLPYASSYSLAWSLLCAPVTL